GSAPGADSIGRASGLPGGGGSGGSGGGNRSWASTACGAADASNRTKAHAVGTPIRPAPPVQCASGHLATRILYRRSTLPALTVGAIWALLRPRRPRRGT